MDSLPSSVPSIATVVATAKTQGCVLATWDGVVRLVRSLFVPMIAPARVLAFRLDVVTVIDLPMVRIVASRDALEIVPTVANATRMVVVNVIKVTTARIALEPIAQEIAVERMESACRLLVFATALATSLAMIAQIVRMGTKESTVMSQLVPMIAPDEGCVLPRSLVIATRAGVVGIARLTTAHTTAQTVATALMEFAGVGRAGRVPSARFLFATEDLLL